MLLHFAYPHLIYIFVPLLLVFALYRLKFHKAPIYQYPLAKMLASQDHVKRSHHNTVFFFLRLATLLGLIGLIMRPQWVDERSKVMVDGIDIILAIDVSGSMNFFDDPNDRRPRLTVAKEEAIRFVEKRIDDPIGLVIFGKEAISRCPLTLDKHILKEAIAGLELGIIDPDGTWLGTGLATAVNRLRSSKAKSKIIVLLTDGEPTAEKIDPELATDMAKKFGIKVYTVGIGNEQGGYGIHPFFGGVVSAGSRLNVALLQKIAHDTGGKFFRAKNPKDMRTIYDTIDRLEKTEHQTNIFHRYYEAFLTFIWIVLLLFGFELLLRLFIWRGILS